MNLYTFFNIFLTALADDDDLQAWAVANFGRPAVIFADIDSENPPEADDDAPYILLHSPGKEAAQDRQNAEYILRAFLCLVSSEQQTRSEANVIEPAGVKLMSQFIDYTVAALKSAQPADFSMAVSIDSDTVGQLPEVHGYMDIIFTQFTTMGTDPIV